MPKTNRRRNEERRAAAARRVAEMRRVQQTAVRRRRRLTVSAVVVVLVVLAVAAAVYVQGRRSAPPVAAGTVPGTTSHYGILIGKKSAPVRLVTYEDFQCSHCRAFEGFYGKRIAKYVAQGTLQVEYRPVAFLSTYSTTALNAALCVLVDGGKQDFLKFHNLLYDNQPPEGGSGLSTAQLTTYAEQAGISGSGVAGCIGSTKYNNWASNATEAMSKAGYNTTPTVLINGKVFKANGNMRAFEQAITAAAQSGSGASPAPTAPTSSSAVGKGSGTTSRKPSSPGAGKQG